MNAATPEAEIRRMFAKAHSLDIWNLLDTAPALAALDVLVAERDRYRDALEQIACSYEWIAFEDDETLPNAGHESITPTNRRIAREALAGSGGDTA